MHSPEWVRRVAGRGYRMLPAGWRYGRAYAGYREDAAAGFDVSAERVEARLSRALKVALAHVPAYARYRELLGDPRPAHLRLRELPLVDKLEIKRDPNRFVATHLPAHKRLPMFTGGSTANPM